MARPDAATHRVDTLGLVMAVVFLAVAAAGLTASPWWLLAGSWKWVAAGVVAAIGLAMVLSSLPARHFRAGGDR